MFSKKSTSGFLLLMLVALSATPAPTLAQSDETSKLADRVYVLERQVAKQSKELSKVEELAKNTAPLLFLFGAFCALWAQNTGRSAWLWFFIGAIFSVFAVVVLLVLNKPPEHTSHSSSGTPDGAP